MEKYLEFIWPGFLRSAWGRATYAPHIHILFSESSWLFSYYVVAGDIQESGTKGGTNKSEMVGQGTWVVNSKVHLNTDG